MNGEAMGQVAVVGLDIAKSVFQVHGVDRDGGVVVRRRLRRSRVLPFFAMVEPCRIGIEACATGHYWARELGALGHDVRLMAPSYVKPYVKRQKNDAADAEAICEAVSRRTMRFVAVKTAEQQSVMVLHRTRLLLMRQRTRLANAIRGHMAEYGIVAPIGREGLQRLIEAIVDASAEPVPPLAGACLRLLVAQLQLVNAQALETDRQIKASARATEVGRRLMEIPGVGPVLASAIVAAVADPGAFQRGRNLAAWIGLVPRQNSSGGGAPGRHQQARSSLPAADAGRWRDGGDPLCAAARHPPAVAGAVAGTAHDQDRCGRARQQDGAHHLGDHDHR
jgi:transposase